MRIHDKAGIWIFKFLSVRTQKVLAENKLSKPVLVQSGVPQSTVLGPLMFSINSLTEEELSSRLGMFADNTRASHSRKNQSNIKDLQDDLDRIFDWQKKNNMEFNEDKFEHVLHGSSFVTSYNIPEAVYFTPAGEEIESKTSVCDLGITMSEKSDFACAKISWIYRTFYSMDSEFMFFMWKTFIQPILDYSSQLWAPGKQLVIIEMEAIFRNYSYRCQDMKV